MYERHAVHSKTLTTRKLTSLPAGKFNDGQGLWLHKRSKDRGRWFLRFSLDGKRNEMGLGGWPSVSLAEAREKASEARKLVRDKIDPIQYRRKQQHLSTRMTVEAAIKSCFEAKRAELKGEGNAGRWMSALNVHVIPKLGTTAIENVDQHDIKKTLSPIWHTKPETARKALNRLGMTLTHAAALGLDVDLQAVLKARALLGKQKKEVKHIPSLPYKDAPDFYRMLCTKEFVSCYALRFLMLTLKRVSEVRFATIDEIDGLVWTIPASRTKIDKEERVPLTTEAVDVYTIARTDLTQPLLFPSPSGKPLSDATMSKFMKDQGYDARPHGFRATFRTWAEEVANAEYEVKEAVLGHVVDSDVVRAYQRSDRFKKRSALLQQWAGFLTSKLL